MNDPLDIRLGRRLQEARCRKGMTVVELASSIAADVAEIERFEAGEQRISSGRLVQACDALNVEPIYFFQD